MLTTPVLGSRIKSSSNKKIRFDTDLVLVRILDHLDKNGTCGSRCTALLQVLDDYNSSDKTRMPERLRDMEDPYHSVRQLLDIYTVALEEHKASVVMISS